jgi:DNA polymerase
VPKTKEPSPSLAFLPERASDTAALAEAAKGCKACHLYANATQTVFGEGGAHAALVLVGEQPGDQEDLQGHPFVGPAGRILDGALEAAGIDRNDVYVTNAVKHFKWEPRGKRRLHAKPNLLEVHACHGWLEAELAAVKPAVVVCMGATAAQAVLGRAVPIGASRGKVLDGGPLAPRVVVTMHPSSLLRLRHFDEKAYARGKEQLADDLRFAASLTEERRRAAPTSRSAASRESPRPRTGPRKTRSASGEPSTRNSRSGARAPRSRGPARPRPPRA